MVGETMVADHALPSYDTREMAIALLLVSLALVTVYWLLVTKRTGFAPPLMKIPASWN